MNKTEAMDPRQVPQYLLETTQIINQQEMKLNQTQQQAQLVDSAGLTFF